MLQLSTTCKSQTFVKSQSICIHLNCACKKKKHMLGPIYRVYQNEVSSSKNDSKLKRLRYFVNIFF